MCFKYTNLLYYKVFSKKNKIINLKTTPSFIGKERWIYYSMSLFVGANLRAYRLLFGYPSKGQRTWSNGLTNKNKINLIYNLKFNKFSKLHKSLDLTKSIFLAEYINLFWHKQWFLEWFSVYKKLQFTPLHIKKNNLVDIVSVNSFNINHNFKYNINRKKKSHKRKRVFPKNKVATGIPFFFSKVYSNKIDKI